jgi:GT2 family glycosyltransferase
VLNLDHENLELVICDNASTDDTEELCRGLAAQDSRIVYHRHPNNVGLLNNFLSALQLATGTFYRWIGDDDWLDPRYVSRCLDAFAADDRLILVTTQIAYRGPDGITRTAPYEGTALGSDDPITRFTEMLRLLNESYLLIDPLYGMLRRAPVVRIERRNMRHEDEVFATKLALAGPWGHVPEVLAFRNWKDGPPSAQALTLDVPSWQAHFRNALLCREVLRWLDQCDLDQQQRRKARSAVARMFMRRQQLVVARRSRKLLGIARDFPSLPLTRSPQYDATNPAEPAAHAVEVHDESAAKS